MCLLIVDWPIKKWSPRQAVGGGNLQIGFKVVEVPPPSLLGAVLILRGTPLNLPSSKHPHPTPLWNFLPHPRGMMTKWPGSATKSWKKFDNKCSNKHWNTVHQDIFNDGMIKENHQQSVNDCWLWWWWWWWWWRLSWSLVRNFDVPAHPLVLPPPICWLYRIWVSHNLASISVYRYTSVPVYHYTSVPVYECISQHFILIFSCYEHGLANETSTQLDVTINFFIICI